MSSASPAKPSRRKAVNVPPQKSLLHIGCGPKRKDQTTRRFNSAAWAETRLDIDPSVNPDVLGTMTDMGAVQSGSVDAKEQRSETELRALAREHFPS